MDKKSEMQRKATKANSHRGKRTENSRKDGRINSCESGAIGEDQSQTPLGNFSRVEAETR